jgi:vitamin B12 transporter
MNYFGVNVVDNWNWFFDPNGFNGPVTISKGDRIRYDYRGEVRVVPNALVLFGASDETETFHTGTLNRSSELKGAFVELQTDYEKRLFLVANGRIDDDEFFGTHTPYRIAPGVIAPWTETKFKGSYGTAFKAPTLVQRFQDFPPTFFANPNLQPESSFGYDYGFEQPLLNKQALVGITWFSNHITNLITSGPNGQIDNSFGFRFLSSRTSTSAAPAPSAWESFAAVNFTERVKVRADYTYTHAIDDITNLELLRRPSINTVSGHGT